MAIERNRLLYLTAKGDELSGVSERFDSPEGDFTRELMDSANKLIKNSNELTTVKLIRKEPVIYPDKILIINASRDRFPLSMETKRVFDRYISGLNKKIPVQVIETKEELLSNVNDKTLVISQCVRKNVFDVSDIPFISQRGAVIVPGMITAPGGILSSKLDTYRLFLESDSDISSPFKIIERGDKSSIELAFEILHRAYAFFKETKNPMMFVKPVNGGSGVGGFRIIVDEDKFSFPDLSRVTGKESDEGIVYLPFNSLNGFQMREFAWIFRMFEKDSHMKKQYIYTTLEVLSEKYGTSNDIDTVKAHVDYCNNTILAENSKKGKPLVEAARILSDALGEYEKRFGRYEPVICEHVDFGGWGLRIHLRLTRAGFAVESIYPRIFQLVLTPEGIGYAGSDNLSSRHTGRIETQRIFPLNDILIESIGGTLRFMRSVKNAVRAANLVAGLVPDELRYYAPLRMEFDMSPLSRKIIEGNADPSRGLCFSTCWRSFVNNTGEWLRDSFSYYSYIKENNFESKQVYDYNDRMPEE